MKYLILCFALCSSTLSYGKEITKKFKDGRNIVDARTHVLSDDSSILRDKRLLSLGVGFSPNGYGKHEVCGIFDYKNMMCWQRKVATNTLDSKRSRWSLEYRYFLGPWLYLGGGAGQTSTYIKSEKFQNGRFETEDYHVQLSIGQNIMTRWGYFQIEWFKYSHVFGKKLDSNPVPELAGDWWEEHDRIHHETATAFTISFGLGI